MSSECIHWGEVKKLLQYLSQSFGTEQECINFIQTVEHDLGLVDLSAVSNLYPHRPNTQRQINWTNTENKYIPRLNAIFKYSVSESSLIARRAVMVFAGEDLHLIKPKLMYSRVMMARMKDLIPRNGKKGKKKNKEEVNMVAPIKLFFSQVQYGKSDIAQPNSHTNKDAGLNCGIALPSSSIVINDAEDNFDSFTN